MDTFHQLLARIMISGAMANPQVHDQDSLTVSDVINFITTKRELKQAERDEINRTGGLNDGTFQHQLILQRAKQEEAFWAAAAQASKNTPPGAENQSSPPCRGI